MPALRLGLFGGTFDPPHVGHLLVAQDVAERLRLDRLVFVPARIPPHKQDDLLSPAPLRLEMVRALIRGNELFRVSEVELSREGPSWTVDTLRHYRDLNPDTELFLLVGADQARSFDSWRNPEEVAELATVVVMEREGTGASREEFLFVPVTRIDLSSTDIRARARQDRPIRYLVPDAVREIIERNRLYRVQS